MAELEQGGTRQYRFITYADNGVDNVYIGEFHLNVVASADNLTGEILVDEETPEFTAVVDAVTELIQALSPVAPANVSVARFRTYAEDITPEPES